MAIPHILAAAVRSVSTVRRWISAAGWPAALAIATAAIALNHLNGIDYILDAMGRGHIAEVNTAYLHQTKTILSDSILVLVALDSGLAVLESSTAGISFIVDVQVQVGSLFSTLQTHIRYALDATMAALGGTLVMENLLALADRLSAPLTTASIVTVAGYVLVRNAGPRVSSVFRKLASGFLLLTLMIHLVFPAMIFTTALASKAFTAPMQTQSHDRFQQIHDQFVVSKGDDIHAHVKQVINKYKSSSGELHEKTRFAGQNTVLHITGLFLGSFLFPLLFLWGLIWLCHVAVRYLMFGHAAR